MTWRFDLTDIYKYLFISVIGEHDSAILKQDKMANFFPDRPTDLSLNITLNNKNNNKYLSE